MLNHVNTKGYLNSRDIMNIYDVLPPDTSVDLRIYNDYKSYFNGSHTPNSLMIQKPSLGTSPQATAAKKAVSDFLNRFIEINFTKCDISFNNNFGNDALIKLML